MEPIEVLQKELDKYKSALSHLEISYAKDDLPLSVYKERKENLLPKIQQYKDAIRTLKIFGS